MTTSKQWLYLSLAFVLVLIGTLALLPVPWFGGKAVQEVEEVSSTPAPTEQTFHLVTTEYKTKLNGEEIEVYRWDPGTLVVQEGDRVNLVLHGIQGKSHRFSLKEFGIEGMVKKGEQTRVRFTADRPGTYELICHDHPSSESHGPMVAYLTVLKNK